jgi:hypothetical protein
VNQKKAVKMIHNGCSIHQRQSLTYKKWQDQTLYIVGTYKQAKQDTSRE